MNSNGNSQVAGLETERDALRRELMGVQEMLAWVLHEVGEPVVVKKSLLQGGLPAGAQITIDDDSELDAFIFGLAHGE